MSKKLLFIRYTKNAAIENGGEQATNKNFRLLERIWGEGNVETYAIHDDSKKHTIADYLKGVLFFPFNYYFGLSPRRVKAIVKKAFDFDAVYIDRSVFGIIAKQLRKKGYKGQIVCFFHNVEVPYFKSKIGRYPFHQVVLHCVDQNDAYCCRYADKIVCLNQRDADELEKRYGRRPDACIPITFKDALGKEDYSNEMTRTKPLCLFIGSYFAPNNEGIEWFMKNVYPYVDIQVKIVGKGMNKLRERYTIPAEAEIISDAPNLRPYFEEADVMVLPIFSGSGMKVKTCESMMYGKNILGTPEAFEGYDMNYSMAGGCCQTAEEFIAALKDLSERPRPRFNSYTRQTYLEKYTEDAVLEQYRGLF